MIFAAPTFASAGLSGLFGACAASILWLPLSASWRQPELRRRRRSAAIANTVAVALLGLFLRLTTPGLRDGLVAADAVWVWEGAFLAGSVALTAATAVLTHFRLRQGWWAHDAQDTVWDRRRWRLAPLAICTAMALVMGWGYNLAARVGAAVEPSRFAVRHALRHRVAEAHLSAR